MSTDLQAMERDAYRAAYSDGTIDLFVGLSLIAIGAIWVWLEDYAGLAGILPAIAAPSLVPLRKQIVENRGGYVRWSAPRRRWERRNLWAMIGLGTMTFLLGIGAFFAFEDAGLGRDLLTDIAPGLLAFILAFIAVVLGVMVQHWRFFAYGVVLVAGGISAVLLESNPGMPLFSAGIAIALIGAAMLIMYLRANPVVGDE